MGIPSLIQFSVIADSVVNGLDFLQCLVSVIESSVPV